LHNNCQKAPGDVLFRVDPEPFQYEVDRLEAGAKAYVAVYSETLKPVAIIRQVILRVMSWENYLFSFMA